MIASTSPNTIIIRNKQPKILSSVFWRTIMELINKVGLNDKQNHNLMGLINNNVLFYLLESLIIISVLTPEPQHEPHTKYYTTGYKSFISRE